MLMAIIHSTRSKPYGVYSFSWDDSTGSGIGEIEEPIATIKDSHGQAPLVQISSIKWGDNEKALPEAERVIHFILLIYSVCQNYNSQWIALSYFRMMPEILLHFSVKPCKISEIYLKTAEFILIEMEGG